MKYTIAALAVTTLTAQAVITVTKDSADFAQNYDGNEIYDGTSYVNGWAAAGGITAQSTSGSVLTLTDGTNGWVEHNTGDPIVSLGATSGWTLEVTLGMDGTDGIALWQDGSNGANGALIYVGANGIGTNGNGTSTNQDISAVSNIGVHTFRLAYDTSSATINIWRDGVFVTDTAVTTNPGGGPRLIIGDCCSNASTGVLFDTIDIHNISYDITGGFAPVPEPSSAALLGLGGIALILRRRK
ncbi:PEP-CTERM sorting domain-containing protein [Oceaniferula spumae]